jgi:signal transduction histidine kinase
MEHLIAAHLINLAGATLMVVMSWFFGRRYPSAIFQSWVAGFACFLTLPAGQFVAAWIGRTIPLTLIQLAGAAAATWFFLVTGRLLERRPAPGRRIAGLVAAGAVAAGGLAIAGVPFELCGMIVMAMNSTAAVRLGWVFLKRLPPEDVVPGAGWVGWTAIALGAWPWVFPYPLLVHTAFAWIGFAVAGLIQLALGVGMLCYIAESSWARYRRAQEALTQVKNEFVSIVGHELRAPLTAVIGYAELMEEEDVVGPLTPLQQEYLAEIQRGGGRLKRLVDDLLDYSLAEHGSLKLDRRAADLGERLRGAVESQRPNAARAGVTLSADLPAGPLVADVDADRIEQVALNLIGNALKFTPAGGEVGVALNREGDTALITVTDTGAGIAEADLPWLFDKFYQGGGPGGQESPRGRGGAGLGLAVAKAIAEAHGGRIRATSEPGHGACFEVRIPIGTPTIEPCEVSADLTAT